ncbi:MAG TPA: hypothetical protein VGQ30_04145 [Gemmatimonadaceae bacterium]|jgi:hypothetical protein|nr:hypothetical protein [Gemmatimonadaceae bacterium]
MQPISVLAMVATLATALHAQVTTLDEGSFTIMRGTDRVGREDFSIRKSISPSGTTFIAHGVVALGPKRIEPVLKSDSAGNVSEYDSEIRESGRVSVSYAGKLARDHYHARILRIDGESSREFRLPPGTVAVEDEIIHQLWFIARRGPGASVPVLSPLRSAVETVHVELVGDEHLSIDSKDFETRHLRLRTEGTGAIRDVWIDAAGRLLKVMIPATKIVAVRDESPR